MVRQPSKYSRTFRILPTSIGKTSYSQIFNVNGNSLDDFDRNDTEKRGWLQL